MENRYNESLNLRCRYCMNKLVALFIIFSPLCAADWRLNSDSSHLSFVSIKNGVFAEVHRFKSLTGGVNEEGDAAVRIGLASVETNIPIRNERLKSMLFEIATFSLATVNSKLNMSDFISLPPGASLLALVPLNINLHGIDGKIPASVKVTRSSESVWHVVSIQPLILDASNYKLAAGIESLRAIAGLNDITTVIPVTFSLEFTRS
ncbi:MAG: hypothetical protein CMP95_08125 [Gammaproteobacteria bacterium]|nr:hypothetical protein [Gammaproteobacteria bacterium]